VTAEPTRIEVAGSFACRNGFTSCVNKSDNLRTMRAPIRIVVWVYVVLAAATLIAQIPIRLHYCTGAPACAWSLLKAPIWAAIWPIYWPAYYGVFR
jgi:hypothetical protein